MRSLLFIILAIVAVLPLYADQVADATNHPITLISVSHPGCNVTEINSLCLVAPAGIAPPLHLRIVQGLADPKAVSLESIDNPGYFLRHQNSRLKLHPYPENDQLFAEDSTFYLITNNDGSISFRSHNYPNQYISVTAKQELYISADPEQPSRSFTLGN